MKMTLERISWLVAWICIILVFMLVLSGCATQKEVVYTTIYPSLQPLQSPNVLSIDSCKWTYPLIKDDKVFIGLDEENFKCYIENKEVIREQMKLYQQFVNEVNAERAEWNKLNSKK